MTGFFTSKYVRGSIDDSTLLDTDNYKFKPIPPSKQSVKNAPTLTNGLEIIPLHAGKIFETNEINLINNGKLGNFFTRLPQYSQIDVQAIGEYITPSNDDNLYS